MANQIRHLYAFGDFKLDADRHRLLRNGEGIPLSPKALDTLLVLIQNPGRLLEREELMQAVWRDTFVEDANLTVAISQLRRALGKDSRGTEYIETIPRIGYRFLREVNLVEQSSLPLRVEHHSVSTTVIEEELSPDENAPDRKTGFSVVTDFLRRHKRISLAVTTACVIGVMAGAAFLSGVGSFSSNSPASAANIRSLAVLPPHSLTTGSDNESLSLGIADALISRLGQLNRLTVRPTSAITRYLGGDEDSLAAARSLAVDAVLEGSLQRAEGRVRVTLRLLDTHSARQLWTAKFDEPDGNIFHLQDSIAQQVATALSLNLSPDENSLLTKRQTSNEEAYRAHLMGNYFWSKRGTTTGKAVDHFRRALELDPMYAEACIGLANVYMTNARWTEAEALIQKALKINSSLPEAHATYGFLKMFGRWDWLGAEKALDGAIELNPNSANAHHWRGVYLSLRGRVDEAKAAMHRALQLDPLSLIITADIAQLHYFAGEYDKAIEYCKLALALDNNFDTGHGYLSVIYATIGREEDAFRELALTWSNPGVENHPVHAEVFERRGWKGIAELELKRNTDRKGLSFVDAVWYLALDNREEALRLLEKSFQDREFLVPFIKVDPRFNSLRNEPRFQNIVSRMGL